MNPQNPPRARACAIPSVFTELRTLGGFRKAEDVTPTRLDELWVGNSHDNVLKISKYMLELVLKENSNWYCFFFSLRPMLLTLFVSFGVNGHRNRPFERPILRVSPSAFLCSNPRFRSTVLRLPRPHLPVSIGVVHETVSSTVFNTTRKNFERIYDHSGSSKYPHKKKMKKNTVRVAALLFFCKPWAYSNSNDFFYDHFIKKIKKLPHT